jgi:hypothetical protein
MTVILRQHLDSETLHVPELRPLVGKDVEITVRELSQTESAALDRWQPLVAIAGQDLIDPQPCFKTTGILRASSRPARHDSG